MIESVKEWLLRFGVVGYHGRALWARMFENVHGRVAFFDDLRGHLVVNGDIVRVVGMCFDYQPA